MSRNITNWLFDNFLNRKSPRRNRPSRTRPVAAHIELLENRILMTIDLGTADTFAVLAGSAVTNTGPSTVQGDVGVSPGSAVTGFPPGSVTDGTIHVADAVATQAKSDLTTAYNEAAGRALTVNLTGQDLGGLTLTPGVYFFASSAQMTGTLTLDAQGDPNAEFVFQIGSTLTTASNSSVVMINGGDPCDVYWQVGSSATLGTTTAFVGHILALTSITLNTGATLDGSALARNGAVTLDNNIISIAGCMTGSISGLKFNDLNGDGVQQPGELGLSGISVFLDANNNGLLDAGESNTVTDGTGNYHFTNLFAGTYRVREVPQAGILQTSPNPPAITLTTNQTVTGVDFGDFTLTTINGAKFQDTNGNGVRNAGEQGLQGFTIFLDANNNGAFDAGERFTTTDANGNYGFSNVGPGTFIVREVQQAGFTQTTANPANIVTSSGTNVGGVDFGNFIPSFQLVTISGTKFLDADSNSIRNVGEQGLQGFTIYLDANTNGTFDAGERFTITDANGNYSFANVGPGTFTVREVQQAGFTQTTVNPANIVTISGTNVTGIDFGNFIASFQLVTISGTKFQDSNGNSVRNIGEQGLQGFTIYLDANNNSTLDVGERFTTTDASGNYSFANVGPGTFIVREIQQSGFTQTTANPANIVTSSGTNVGGIDFGNFQLITIGGTKFQDTNGNGARNAGESGLPGIKIYLDANNNGLFDTGERFTFTDVGGSYSFTNVGPGTFIVREVLQAGFVQTTVNPANIVTSSGTNIGGIDFGNFQLVLIGGTKFQDTNGNGVRNSGEPGLPGIKIYLDANNNGLFDTGERFAFTDASGNYSFANVGPGTFMVREVLQAGFVQTTVNPANIVTSSGTNVGGINFGNFQQILIGGTKFQDTNGNGVRNAGEQGLPGIKIYLDANNNGTLDAGERFTTTDASGNYSFANVGPGTFIVREVLQTGFVQTTANPTNIVTSSGANVGGIDFGNFQLIIIGGTKFQDTNGNGLRDSGEPGLQGFTIYIDANNNHVFDAGERSTTTSSNGTYSFANLGPGTFRVREVPLNNFVKMTNDPAAIVATSGGNATDILFGNMPVSNLFTVSKLAMTGQNLTNYQNGNFGRQATYVANLYETLLGHAPDLKGLTYYVRLLMAGYSQTQVTSLFKTDNHLAV